MSVIFNDFIKQCMILSENNVKANNLYKLIQTAIAKSCKVFEM